VTGEDQNTQIVNDFVKWFALLLIIIIGIIIALTINLLLSQVPVKPTPHFQNFSFESNVTGLNVTPQIFQNGSIEGILIGPNSTAVIFHNSAYENNTTLLSTISHYFGSATIATTYNSLYTEGTLLNLLFNNFTVFLAIIGAFSLFCYFYFSITFKADVISEYSESDQKNPIIFFQIAFLLLILFVLYVISLTWFKLIISIIELIIVGCFFVLEILISAIFSDYVKNIRDNFNNMVQFAAIRDYYSTAGNDIFEILIYFISIWDFMLIFLIAAFGAICDFTIFSVIFIITLNLLMVWQINIINNGPSRIFEVKSKTDKKSFIGFLLTDLNKEIVTILVKDDTTEGKIFNIPQSSIEYIVLNRTISKTELITPPKSAFNTLKSGLNSLSSVINFLKGFFGFGFGIILGIFLYIVVEILNINFGFPPQDLIVIGLLFAGIVGFLCCRVYQSYQEKKIKAEDAELRKCDDKMKEDPKNR